MHPEPGDVMSEAAVIEVVVIELETVDGPVVAIIDARKPSDEVLERAVAEAVARSGDLVVVQLVSDPSAVRRALAKALLARDIAWWIRDVVGIRASIDAMADGALDDAVGLVDEAACVVLLAGSAASGPAMARIVSAAWDQRAATHPWPDVSVVATDHWR